MPATSDKALLQNVAIAMISLAKSELSDEQFQQLSIPSIQHFVALLSEAIPINHLSDTLLLRHGIDQLSQDHSVEEALMHVFTLSIFRLSSEGSNHPLERGIIRQKIIGLLPICEKAMQQGLIRTEIYDKNADALAHIADSTGDVPELLEALSHEYLRLRR